MRIKINANIILYTKTNIADNSIVDFSMPSTQKRLLVLDMNAHRVLFNSHVAHGRNSGSNYATAFSNKVGSYQSSLGFYITENRF